MTLRRRKSRSQQAADLVASYLKLKAASKAAKGAKKAAKGTAVYQTAKRTPFAKRVPLLLAGAGIAVAGIAAAVVTKLRSGDDSSPATA
jgi:hypothetical protein